jgi:hypothetical protein
VSPPGGSRRLPRGLPSGCQTATVLSGIRGALAALGGLPPLTPLARGDIRQLRDGAHPCVLVSRSAVTGALRRSRNIQDLETSVPLTYRVQVLEVTGRARDDGARRPKNLGEDILGERDGIR